jgi:predicted RND superfamily exporter protein
MLIFSLVQNPIIVDVGRQPDPTGDISIDFVIGMFAMAGVLLAVAIAGCVIVAGIVIFIKRRRAAMDDSDETTSHTRLKI